MTTENPLNDPGGELVPEPGTGEGTAMPPAAATPLAETAVEIEELDVDAPAVAILMGSKSDLPAMEKAETELTDRGIRSETRVMSAHREPDTVAEYDAVHPLEESP